MLWIKIAPVLVIAALAAATDEKKIDLQDIENDNLNSENQKDDSETDQYAPTKVANEPSNLVNPDSYFNDEWISYNQLRPAKYPPGKPYIRQYSVSEPSEKQNYGTSYQQPNIGYVTYKPPTQYYLVNEANEPSRQPAQAKVQYAAAAPQVYQQIVDSNNYLGVPALIAPTGAGHIQQYSQPLFYYSYTQPTAAPAPVQAVVNPPMLAYQVPVIQYPSALVAPTARPAPVKECCEPQPLGNDKPVVESQDEPPKSEESPKQPALPEIPYPKNSAPEYPSYHYLSSTPLREEPKFQKSNKHNALPEVVYSKNSDPEYSALQEVLYPQTSLEYPRYYNSRTPLRGYYKNAPVAELPPPNPIILKGSPPHLAHLPKALPMFRPLNKPVYAAGVGLIPSAYNPRPSEMYGLPHRSRPTSLLDSYIPSQVLYHYLTRGYAKDPPSVYEALSSGRYQAPSSERYGGLSPQRYYVPMVPRKYETGFLPNQMYHTAEGGVTYGHYKKRSPNQKKPMFHLKKDH